MAPARRRVLVAVLLLALALTACGRSGSRVTADDGRGIDRPGGGIWIPETRAVDDGDAPAERPDDTEPAPTAAADAPQPTTEPGTERSSASAPPAPPVADRPTPTSATAPVPSPPRRRSTGTDAGTPSGEPADERPDEDAQPHEPEVVGDCGVTASGPPPTRRQLEAAVERLRAMLDERWPQTHAGAWTVDEEDQQVTVHVGFTTGVRSSLRAVCDEFDHPELLHGVRTELSDAQLQDLQQEVHAERDALRDGDPPDDLPAPIRATGGRYAAAVDHAANGLRVIVEDPDDELRDAFRERYTPRLVLVRGRFDADGEPVEDEA